MSALVPPLSVICEGLGAKSKAGRAACNSRQMLLCEEERRNNGRGRDGN